MTQAFNLSQLANNTNSSGQINADTAIYNTVNVANGGTNLSATPANGQLPIGNGSGYSLANLSAGSGIAISNGAGAITISNTSAGTVTSIATGNGLQGGTITSSGTLSLAAPSFNTVGSYCAVVGWVPAGTLTLTAGSNYAAGTGTNQFTATTFQGGLRSNSLSGTWKWMSGTISVSCSCPSYIAGLAVRVA